MKPLYVLCILCIVAIAVLLILNVWSVIDLREIGGRMVWTLVIVAVASGLAGAVLDRMTNKPDEGTKT